MKSGTIAVLALLISAQALAGGASIYGWDIECRGEGGIKVNASQSDDDFYITYEGGKLRKGRVWADTADQNDSRLRNLLFMTNQAVSKGPEASLAILRGSSGFGYATGVLVLEGERHELNCYVRYGVDEDAFDAVSRKPFPAISAPAKEGAPKWNKDYAKSILSRIVSG